MIRSVPESHQKTRICGPIRPALFMQATLKPKFKWGPFLKQLMVIAIPVSLQHLLTTTGTMVDTIMISALGDRVVGAVGLCGQFSSLLVAGFWGFMGGGMLFMSQYWGAKDEDALLRSYGIMWICMMTVSLFFCVAATCFPEVVMRVYTDKEATREIGVEYLRIVGFNYPLMVFCSAAAAFLRSTERVRIPLYASVSGVLVNVALNYLLISGHLGFPALGVKGAAIATVAGGAVNLLIIFVASQASGFKYLFMFRRHFRFVKGFLGSFFKKCFPILCNEILIGVSNALISIVFGHQSEAAIAAVAVVTTMEGIVISFFEGFANAGSILVGKSVGAGHLEEGYRRAPRIILVLGVVMVVLCSTIVLISSPIFTAMGLHDESLTIAKQMIIVFAIAMTFRMMNWVNNEIHRAAGDAFTGTVMEIGFMYLMVLPILYVTAYVWTPAFVFIYAARYVDEPFRFVIMNVHLAGGRWVRPVTSAGKKALPEFWKAHHIKEKTKAATP